MTDPAHDYGVVSRINHWLVAVAVIALLALGLMFEDLPRGDERQYLQGLHVSIGALAALVILFRVGWSLARPRLPDQAGPAWERAAARVVHFGLLASIAVLAVTGPLAPWTVGRGIDVFGWFTLPSPLPAMRSLHEAVEVVHAVTAKFVLLPLLVLHVAATAKHAIVDRDGRWRRMMPFGRSRHRTA